MNNTNASRSPSSGGRFPASIAARSEHFSVEAIESLAQRIRNEYLEMPGLSLTLTQAQRMWHLDRRDCESLLDSLVADGFLSQTTRGAFVWTGSGIRRV